MTTWEIVKLGRACSPVSCRDACSWLWNHQVGAGLGSVTRPCQRTLPMVAVAVPECMDTNSQRTRGVPFHWVVSPLPSFARNPSFNRPLAGTADTGTS